MHTPPVRSHTIYVANTPTPSPSSPHKLRSSFTTLPSVNSSTAFSSHSLKPPSLQQSPWSSGGKQREVSSRQNNESRRSVRWQDGKDGSSSKWTDDPAKMWARYTKTVRPEFKLHEPSRGRMPGGKNGRGAVEDPEEANKFVMKLSLPCPSHSSCCFCVYSRQLGPVRVYFSRLPRPKLHGGGRTHRVNNGVKHAAHTDAFYPLDLDENNRVFLKERWMTCSAPSGEVIVPDYSADPVEVLQRHHNHHHHHHTHRTPALLGEVNGGKIQTENGFRWTRNFNLGTRESSRSKQWQRMRNSSSLNLSQHDSAYPILANDPRKKPYHQRPATFGNDDMGRTPSLWANEDPVLRVPRNSPRSLGSSTVNVEPARRGEKNRKEVSFVTDAISGPPSFPSQKTSVPLKLLSKRQGVL